MIPAPNNDLYLKDMLRMNRLDPDLHRAAAIELVLARRGLYHLQQATRSDIREGVRELRRSFERR